MSSSPGLTNIEQSSSYNELEISAISDSSSHMDTTDTEQISELNLLLKQQSDLIGDYKTRLLAQHRKQEKHNRTVDNRIKALEKRLASLKEDQICESLLSDTALESEKKHRRTDSEDHQNITKKIREEHQDSIERITHNHQIETAILRQQVTKAEEDANIFRRLLTMESKTSSSSSLSSSSYSSSCSSSSSSNFIHPPPPPPGPPPRPPPPLSLHNHSPSSPPTLTVPNLPTLSVYSPISPHNSPTNPPSPTRTASNPPSPPSLPSPSPTH